MSRYEITDDGKLILIECPDGRVEILRPTEPDVGVYLDDVVIAVIRQQQSEIAELTAERDQLRARLAETETELRALCEASAPLVGENAKLRARLAAIDAAPTVATVCIAPTSDFPVLKYSRYDIPRINGTELIARPAKDGGT
jgi:hypothetical protein